MNIKPPPKIISAIAPGAILHDIPNRIRNERHKQKVTDREAQTCPVPSGRLETVQYRAVRQQVGDRGGDSEGVQTGDNEYTLLEEAAEVSG